jgi:uncharacterized SAM-binding protein YcdF (DUF218 family)
MSFRWLLWSLLSPSQVLLGAMILGALLLAARRDRAGRLLCIASGVGLLAFGLLPLSHGLVERLETRFPQPQLPSQVAGIVLLAGAERPVATERFGEPQFNEHAARYTTTLRLALRHPAARVVFSGGPAVDARTGRLEQGGVARRLLASTGLDPARVTFEDGSGDTCASAANTRALVQPQPGETWVVVTSALHVPRTVACFRAVGWDVIPQPADYQADAGGWGPGSFRIAQNLALFDAALHEWLGLLYYRLTGRTRELLPAPLSGSYGPAA